MLSIDFTKNNGLIVKNDGNLIDGVQEVKINIDTANQSPEIILTIKPKEVRILSDITYPRLPRNQ